MLKGREINVLMAMIITGGVMLEGNAQAQEPQIIEYSLEQMIVTVTDMQKRMLMSLRPH